MPRLNAWAASTPARAPQAAGTVAMTPHQLEIWAANNGKILVDKAKHAEMCAAAVANIAAKAELDKDYAALFGAATLTPAFARDHTASARASEGKGATGRPLPV